MSAARSDHVDAALRDAIDRTLEEIAAGLAGHDAVTAAIRYALRAGGKRLRPVLCLAAMDAAAAADRASAADSTPGAADRASAADSIPGARAARLRAACSLELIHTYSLVHDDLPCMDDDDLRRGQPTTHRAFGSRAAMLAGFALIPQACLLLHRSALTLGVEPARAADAVRELCRAAGPAGMVGGQLLDLESEGRALDAPELRRVHAMKTGALFRGALRIGGILGGASPVALEALGEYGSHLGLAFQITDDVLDVTMDSAALGKTAGKDRDADKATFAARLGVGRAREAAGTEVDAALAALTRAGLESAVLEGLARFAADRNR